jgi:hypothetical protein
MAVRVIYDGSLTTNNLVVDIDWTGVTSTPDWTNGTFAWTNVLTAMIPNAFSPAVGNEFRIGWAAGTGSNSQYHEIDDFYLQCYP